MPDAEAIQPLRPAFCLFVCEVEPMRRKVGVAHGAELCKGTQGKLAHFAVHIGQRTRHFLDKLPARIGDVDADKICFLNGKSVHAHTSIS